MAHVAAVIVVASIFYLGVLVGKGSIRSEFAARAAIIAEACRVQP
jgi:hypothetical protein